MSGAAGPDAGLRVDTNGRIRRLTIDRPERKNALSRALLLALVAALDEADADPQISVVVLTGSGGVFSSGTDLKDMRARDEAGAANVSPYLRDEANPFERIAGLTKPVIAAVDGPAVAAGMELALACDLRIASAASWFSLPEATRGLAAQFASVVLPRTVPPAVAAEWLYTGRKVSAEEAFRWGFLNRVTDGPALAAAEEIAAGIAGSAPLSLQRMKRLARETWAMTLGEALRHQPGPDPYSSEDRAEGVRAFIEKRPPVWRGK